MKTLFIILCFLLLVSCSNEPFVGYVVCKKYTPEHMCHDDVVTTVESNMLFVHVPIVPHQHHHTLQEACYRLFVANCDNVREITVTQYAFKRFHLLDKVSDEQGGIRLITRIQ